MFLKDQICFLRTKKITFSKRKKEKKSMTEIRKVATVAPLDPMNLEKNVYKNEVNLKGINVSYGTSLLH